MLVEWTFTFASIPLGERLVEAATVTIVGMGTVLVSLWVIGEIFTLLNRAFQKSSETSAPKATETSQVAQSASSIDAHLLPVLVAAATVAVGRRVIVRRITFLNRDTVSGWAEAGRTSIHSSHNLRRTER